MKIGKASKRRKQQKKNELRKYTYLIFVKGNVYTKSNEQQQKSRKKSNQHKRRKKAKKTKNEHKNNNVAYNIEHRDFHSASQLNQSDERFAV